MIQITKVTDLGNDTLEVRGFDDADTATELVARGWMSAISNHYEPTQYDQEGNLVVGTNPRAMTDGEKTAYWKGLLQAQIPPVAISTSQAVLFENPTAQAVLDQAQITP